MSEYSDCRVRIVSNVQNVGVAEGNNIGIRAALRDGCSQVLLVNNDTVFGSDLLSSLNSALTSNSCDMVVPKILYFDAPDTIWCAGGYFSLLHGTSRHFGFDKKDEGQFDEPRFVPYSPTCCMLIKSEVFARIGLMDANYFVYFDDTDFCYRAKREGLALFYWPATTVLHKVSSLTGGGQSEFTLQYCTRNHVYYLLKNLPRWQVFFYLPFFQLRLLIKHICLSRTFRTFWTAEKAFFSGVALFNSRRSLADQST